MWGGGGGKKKGRGGDSGLWESWEGEGKEGESKDYLKLEKSMFIPLGCKLPKRNMRCCSSNLRWDSLWPWRRPRTERSDSEWEGELKC